MNSNKVQQLIPTINTEKSLRPVFKWMQLIGAIASPSSNGHCIYNFGHHYRFSFWLFSFAVNGFILYYWLDLYFMSKKVSVSNWITLISDAFRTMHTAGIHTILFYLFNNRWNELIELLNKTKYQFAFKGINYSKVWRLSVVGVIYIILMVVLYFIIKESKINKLIGRWFRMAIWSFSRSSTSIPQEFNLLSAANF